MKAAKMDLVVSSETKLKSLAYYVGTTYCYKDFINNHIESKLLL